MRQQLNPAMILCLDDAQHSPRSHRCLNPTQALAPLFVIAKSASNDEVERCGVALPANEADLSQSSTSSLAHRRRDPRSLEPIVMRYLRDHLSNPIIVS